MGTWPDGYDRLILDEMAPDDRHESRRGVLVLVVDLLRLAAARLEPG